MIIELHWIWLYVLHLTPTVFVLALGIYLYRGMKLRIQWQKKSTLTRQKNPTLTRR